MAKCEAMDRGYAHRIDIRADSPKVWSALTETSHLRQWCSPHAMVRAETGGRFCASVDRMTELEARIEVLERHRRLCLLYLPQAGLPSQDAILRDDFLLEGTAAGTLVRLLGSGVPGTAAWDTQFQRLRTGWRQALNRLKVYVERSE